jgi:hypothetical protein
VRDEKMLEKLTMHDIQDVTELFSLADKCTRAMPSTPHLLQRRGRVPSLKRELLPNEVAARTRIRKRRRPTAITNRWLETPPP